MDLPGQSVQILFQGRAWQHPYFLYWTCTQFLVVSCNVWLSSWCLWWCNYGHSCQGILWHCSPSSYLSQILGPEHCSFEFVHAESGTAHFAQPDLGPLGLLTALIERIIDKIDAENLELYVMGDLNCNLLSEVVSNNSSHLLNIIDIYGVTQLITEPTRVTQYSSTLID